jgi:hypothetical protein
MIRLSNKSPVERTLLGKTPEKAIVTRSRYALTTTFKIVGPRTDVGQPQGVCTFEGTR